MELESALGQEQEKHLRYEIDQHSFSGGGGGERGGGGGGSHWGMGGLKLEP